MCADGGPSGLPVPGIAVAHGASPVSRRCLSARDGHYAPQGVARLRELPGYGYPLGPHAVRPRLPSWWRSPCVPPGQPYEPLSSFAALVRADYIRPPRSGRPCMGGLHPPAAVEQNAPHRASRIQIVRSTGDAVVPVAGHEVSGSRGLTGHLWSGPIRPPIRTGE